MSEDIIQINVKNIFDDKYIIPIYQRKYAWTDKEIEQLIEDIITNGNNKYYLGTLTVDKRKDGKYEVIDGQQRLTTLYLIMLYLNKINKTETSKIEIQNVLEFEARQTYSDAISTIKENSEYIVEDDNAQEIYDGYKCIENYFKKNKSIIVNNSKKTITEILSDSLKKTILVRVQVPRGTDLNHYFEIMNTRGEQLELHHIAKAKFLDILGKNKDEKIALKNKKIASIVWDACSQMNKHIQMNFVKGVRDKLFFQNVDFTALGFEEQWERLTDIYTEIEEKEVSELCEIEEVFQLKDILEESNQVKNSNNKKNDNDETYPFESIITFPYFLLYVNAVINKNSSYDDIKLLDILKDNYSDEEKAKQFICSMLCCRILFDKYIIKRKNNNSNDENMSLKYVVCKNNTYQMCNTYGTTDKDYEEDEIDKSKYTRKRLIVLQSILQITYTSQQNKQWITELLKHLLKKDGENWKNRDIDKVTNILEKYCIDRIKKFYDCENVELTEASFNDKKGFDIAHIVFTYLDYILWREGYDYENNNIIVKKQDNWKVQYRNSIEHFFPQNPEKNEDRDKWINDLDCFGNLALITKSGNSRLSNLMPDDKAAIYKKNDLIKQNPKLKIMANMTNSDDKWDPKKAKQHQEDMFKILKDELENKIVNE